MRLRKRIIISLSQSLALKYARMKIKAMMRVAQLDMRSI